VAARSQRPPIAGGRCVGSVRGSDIAPGVAQRRPSSRAASRAEPGCSSRRG